MQHAQKSDAELVALTLSGDQSAYEQLVTRHQSAAIAAATRVIGSPYLAEDAVQDAFVTAWMKLDTLDQPGKFGVWVCRIARNCAINIQKRIRYTLPEDALEQIPEDYPSPEEALIRSEEKRIIHESIAKLPEKIAETIRLHYFYGLPVADIAARLGLSEGGVKWRLHKGRQSLKEALAVMEETNTDTLVQRVMKKVEEFKGLGSRLYNYRRNELETFYEETLSEVEKLPESTDKQNMLADVLSCGFSWIPGKYTESQLEALWDAAIKSGNEDAIRYVIQHEYFTKRRDRVKILLEKRIPDLEARGYTKMLGWIWFWLGHAQHEAGDHQSGFASFKKVRQILTPADAYYAATLSAEKLEREYMEIADRVDQNQRHFVATGHVFRYADGELHCLVREAYNREGDHMPGVYFHPFIFDTADGHGNRLFFDAKNVGDSLSDGHGGNLIYGGAGHTVETPAGIFGDCVLWTITWESKRVSLQRYDTYYKEGIGIVRQDYIGTDVHEFYHLTEYNIAGGSGLLPVSAGNRWSYISSRNPSYYDSLYTMEFTYADSETLTVSAYYRIFRYGYDPGNWRDMAEACGLYVGDPDGKLDISYIRPYMERMRALADTRFQRVYAEIACRVMERAMSTDGKLNPNRIKEGIWNTFNCGHITKKDGRIRFCNDYLLGFEINEYTTTPYAVQCCSLYDELRKMIDDWNDEIVKKQDQAQYFEVLRRKIELTVTAAGTVVTPAGSFDGCLEFKMRRISDFAEYIVEKSEYCFAPNVGIVRAVHHFVDGQPDGVYELCEYEGVGEGYFPQEDGFRRLYRAVGLPAGYLASAEYTVVRGDNGELYLLTDLAGTRDLTDAERFGEIDEQQTMLLDLANAYLEEHKKEFTYNDCVIYMISSKKNVYHFFFDGIDPTDDTGIKSLQKLVENGDTVIEGILVRFLCGLELPPYRFRDALIDLNKENLNAKLYLPGLYRVISKKIADTLPPDEDSRTDEKN